ncbi:MAG TPA: ATP-binding cassette domain-containing protein [Conexibacter sp.]|nr:ATP-binding cassette domain-containing protein [Conexibacter sp.]
MSESACREAGSPVPFQGARLFGDLSVLENAEVAALAHGTRRAGARAEAARALALVGLEDRADTPAAALSCGAQRQASIARAVAMRPRFLLLDEPAAGLNEDEGRELVTTIEKLCESGVGVLLVEHDMEVAMGVSHRVHVLDSGRTICEGSPAEVQADATVIAAYLGAGHGA